MITTSYEYAIPRTAAEAATLLAEDGSVAIAGGQTLVAELKTSAARPSMLVDLSRIESLRGIERHGTVVRIGAMTTLAELTASRDLPPVLAEAAGNVADPQVRNRATVGGNLRTSARGSDLAPVLLALGATANVIGADDSTETVPLEDYLARPLQGVLSSVDVPVLRPGEACAIERFSDRPGRPPLCAAAVWVNLTAADDGSRIASCRIAVAAGGSPRRMAALERDLERAGADNVDTVREACEQFVTSEDFSTDIAASGEYRAHLARTLIRRAFGQTSIR
jgi:aerobic carbon-monoxide dehydrogenase medium subunit